MNIDILEFKQTHGKGPSDLHPLVLPPTEIQPKEAQWHFRIESSGVEREFVVPGTTRYGEVVKLLKGFLARNLALQNKPKVRLIK